MTKGLGDPEDALTTARRDHNRLERLKICAFLTLYVTGLWGQAARTLPAPFSDWHGVPYRVVAPWWHENVLPHLSFDEQVALFQVISSYLFALAIPLLALRSLGISPSSVGLGRTRVHGLSVTTAGVVVTLPVGFWLVIQTPDPWGSPLQEALEFLTLVPEHFLIFGVFGVLLLPGQRLSWPLSVSGMTGAGVFAVLATGIVFLLIHVGTPHSAELWASLPLGLGFAVMTFVSGSIWPAVIAHITLNVFPMMLVSTPS